MGVSGRHPPGVTGSVPRGDTLKLTSCFTHLRPHLSLVRACSARPFLRRSSHPTLPSFPEGRTQALLPTDLVKTETRVPEWWFYFFSSMFVWEIVDKVNGL